MTNAIVAGQHHQRIGIGCWQLAGAYTLNGRQNGYSAIDLEDATRAIHIALDNGVSFFDTASGYGFGLSETRLANALRTYRGSVKREPFICTKFALIPGSDDQSIHDYSEKNLIANVEESLRRLDTECLGAILLHNPPDDFNYHDYDPTPFERLKSSGKILSYGVSCRSMKGVENVTASRFGNVVEAVYNVVDRRLETYFSDLELSNYLFISRVPLASGFISKKTLTSERQFPVDDIRNGFSTEQNNWVTEQVRKLSFLDELEGGITVSALRFQMSNSHNTISVPGVRNVAQCMDVVKALQLGPLPPDVVSKIAETVPDVYYRWKG